MPETLFQDRMPFDAAHLDWPTFGWAADVRPALADALEAGRSVGLATLYRTAGPSPRIPGAQMLIEPDRLTGYLSGGCLEADVAGHAMAALTDGEPRRLVYGQGSPFRDIRLPCGGRLEVLVEAIPPDDPATRRLLELGATRTAARWWSNGRARGCEADAEEGAKAQVDDDPFRVGLRIDPAPRLVVVGGDPIALAIARLGVLQGQETWLVRPKGPPDPPFPDLRYSRDEPARALPDIGLDRWTAVVAASHDPEVDEAALAPALSGRSAYVGVLGARSRIPERRRRLSSAGVADGDLDRLRAPVGLGIGARTPWEIAVAVHAEIIAAANGASRPKPA